jgi:hypothetical protein
VRADATFWDGASRRVIPDEFFAERGGGDVPVTQPIALGGHDVGPWNVVTLVWDVGGGHFDCGSDSFWHGGVADIREPGSGDLAFSIAGGRPNPSSEYVRWDVTQAAREPVHLGVVSVDGRLVRQWQKAELQPGRNRIVWDGRNDRGGKVAAGRYYLIATDSRGRQRSSPIIILR